MIVEGVDPRDIGWEVDQPVYRVHFWRHPAAPAGVVQEQSMRHCEEHRLTGATGVDEALDWARGRVGPDRTFVLYAECDDRDGKGLLRLWGTDPSHGT